MNSPDIQYFRAIAIIAVVMIHTTPAGEMQVICKPFINFAVATFIFLSGYLTKADNDNWLAFYRRRITRVLVPYDDLEGVGTYGALLRNPLSGNISYHPDNQFHFL